MQINRGMDKVLWELREAKGPRRVHRRRDRGPDCQKGFPDKMETRTSNGTIEKQCTCGEPQITVSQQQCMAVVPKRCAKAPKGAVENSQGLPGIFSVFTGDTATSVGHGENYFQRMHILFSNVY